MGHRVCEWAGAAVAAAWLLGGPAMADSPALADSPASVPGCPPSHLRVVQSTGGTIDYLGSQTGIGDLCHMRRGGAAGDFYLGSWRLDWPGAGEAYPALWTVLHGGRGAKAGFVTRSVPGLQWNDSFANEGVESVSVGGVPHRALRIAHEREGIEGNTYHSIITSWRDVATGVTLKAVEMQISGQSYGPDTTWEAVRVDKLP